MLRSKMFLLWPGEDQFIVDGSSVSKFYKDFIQKLFVFFWIRLELKLDISRKTKSFEVETFLLRKPRKKLRSKNVKFWVFSQFSSDFFKKAK